MEWSRWNALQWSGMEWMHFEHVGSFCSLWVILGQNKNISKCQTFGPDLFGHLLDKKTPFQNVRPSGRICWSFFDSKNEKSKSHLQISAAYPTSLNIYSFSFFVLFLLPRPIFAGPKMPRPIFAHQKRPPEPEHLGKSVKISSLHCIPSSYIPH